MNKNCIGVFVDESAESKDEEKKKILLIGE